MKDFRDIGRTLLVTFLLGVFYFLFVMGVDHLFAPQIFFYSALKCLALFLLLSSVALFIFRKKFKLDIKRIFYSEIIFLLASYSFIITLPVTVDRSFSIYMLGALYNSEEKGHALTINQLAGVTQSYFFDKHLIQKRMDEQLATGSLTIDKEDKIALTEKGKLIVLINKSIGSLFNLDKRNYDPEVSFKGQSNW